MHSRRYDVIRIFIISLTVMLCSAAEKTTFWTNTQKCPLEIREHRDFILVINKYSHDVSEFQLGCIRLGNTAQWEIGKVVESVKGPIVALNGFYLTSSNAMQDLHYNCSASNWSLGIVKILFDDGSVWDLKNHKALLSTEIMEANSGVQPQEPLQLTDLRIEHADVPSYPQLARIARIFGTAQVKVTVVKGEVASTNVISGPTILASAAVENILTWRFNPLVNATFTTKFIYQLEENATLDPQNPKVELQLPLLVKITAAPVYLDQKEQN